MSTKMEIKSKQQILERYKEIEQELLDMLRKTESDFGLNEIKEVIYNEDGQDSLTDIIAMFDTGQDAIELENVLGLVNDVWNYFPHKILGGLSPAEKMLEYEKKDNGVRKGQKLTKKQIDLLWSGGGKGPYSQAILKKRFVLWALRLRDGINVCKHQPFFDHGLDKFRRLGRDNFPFPCFKSLPEKS